MAWVERRSEPYRAYEGPPTGGFSVVPPSVVPALPQGAVGVDPLTQVAALGRGRWVERPAGDPAAAPPAAVPMAAETIAPKGGAPYQPNMLVAEAHELYRQMMQGGDYGGALPTSPEENASIEFMKTHADNLLATPSVLADLATYPQRTMVNLAMGNDLPSLRAMPRVDTAGIAAKLRAATSDITEDQALANIERADAVRRAKYPISTLVGSVGGDIATLATGRAPFTGVLRKGEIALGKKMKHGRTMYSQWPFLDKAARSEAIRKSVGWNTFKRGMRRTGEAGVEGAALALLKDGDPLEAAGFTAGSQAGLSAVTDLLTRKYVKLPSRVATFAVNAGVLSGLFYAADIALPGEARDYEANKHAVQKMLWGYGIGGLTAALSARARSGALSAGNPHLMDALGSAPRNAMQSVLVDYLGRDDVAKQDIKTKVQKLYQNIDKFSESQLNSLSAAFQSGSKDRFYRELDKAVGGLQ